VCLATRGEEKKEGVVSPLVAGEKGEGAVFVDGGKRGRVSVLAIN